MVSQRERELIGTAVKGVAVAAVFGYFIVHQSCVNYRLRDQIVNDRAQIAALEVRAYEAERALLERVPTAVRMVEGRPGLLETELELVPLVQDQKNERLYLPAWEKRVLNPKVLLELEESRQQAPRELTLHASYVR